MAGELQKLKAIHREIARLLVAGMPVPKIAEHLGISRGTIYTLKKSPMWCSLFGELSAEADKNIVNFEERVQFARDLGLERITEVLEVNADVGKALQIKSAFDVLDRGGQGYKVPDKIVENTINFQMNFNEMSDADLHKELAKVRAERKIGVEEAVLVGQVV